MTAPRTFRTLAALVLSMRAGRGGHLETQSAIGDILRHPALTGFSGLILPWDDRCYDESMRLTEIGSLLPYHTHVDPETMVSALNRMIYVASLHEGFPYAAVISGKAYNAFVLKYRAGQGGAAATEDLAAAVSYILRNAATLGVSTRGYSLWGSSAGARMAAAIGSHGTARFGGGDVPKPAAIVMAYSDYSFDEPPTFVVVGERDGIAPPARMEARVEALRRSGAMVEYRKYKNLGHGFGLGSGTSAEGWVLNAIRFWETSICKLAN